MVETPISMFINRLSCYTVIGMKTSLLERRYEVAPVYAKAFVVLKWMYHSTWGALTSMMYNIYIFKKILSSKGNIS